MQEVQANMQRVQEIKAEIDILKQVETKVTKPTKATNNNNKISCVCGCTILLLLINLHGIATSKQRNI
jgi:hypothetical protein